MQGFKRMYAGIVMTSASPEKTPVDGRYDARTPADKNLGGVCFREAPRAMTK